MKIKKHIDWFEFGAAMISGMVIGAVAIGIILVSTGCQIGPDEPLDLAEAPISCPLAALASPATFGDLPLGNNFFFEGEYWEKVHLQLAPESIPPYINAIGLDRTSWLVINPTETVWVCLAVVVKEVGHALQKT